MACPPPEIDWSSWATWSCLREDIAPIATFVGAAIVALAALAQAGTARRRHQEQTAADRERRITESFAKAVEQLGSDKLETRLGAVYTLERISQESEREYWPIMETLTAYVREHAPWPPRQALANPFVALQGSSERAGESTPAEEPAKAAEPASSRVRPATDIQAILAVLGRRDEKVRKQDKAAERRLDLRAIDLRGAILRRAHLEGADLAGAHLEGARFRIAQGADLMEALLEGADFVGAHLEGASFGIAQGADLVGAHLEGASFAGAHLEYANLAGAHLEGANLWGAHLKGAILWDAHLKYAILWEAHLEGAILRRAHLEGASFGVAQGTDLMGAHLEGPLAASTRSAQLGFRGAHLEGADLQDAFGLTQEQLAQALGDATTKVADELRPADWPAAANAQPEEPDNSK